MKIEILSVAMSDIQFGQRFYEQQQGGAYFVSGQSVQVWRVLDCRQKPSRIAMQLNKN